MINSIGIIAAANTLTSATNLTQDLPEAIQALASINLAQHFDEQGRAAIENSLSRLVSEICPTQSPLAMRTYLYALGLLRREQITRLPEEVKTHPAYFPRVMETAINFIFDSAHRESYTMESFRQETNMICGVYLNEFHYLVRPCSVPDKLGVQYLTISSRDGQNMITNERIMRVGGLFIADEIPFSSLDDLLNAKYKSIGFTPTQGCTPIHV